MKTKKLTIIRKMKTSDFLESFSQLLILNMVVVIAFAVICAIVFDISTGRDYWEMNSAYIWASSSIAFLLLVAWAIRTIKVKEVEEEVEIR